MKKLARKKLALQLIEREKRPYYCEVEYLESTGTQYIDTGLVGRTGYTVEADMAFTALSTGSYQYFAGYAYTGASDRIYFIGVRNTVNKLGYTYGNDTTITV